MQISEKIDQYINSIGLENVIILDSGESLLKYKGNRNGIDVLLRIFPLSIKYRADQECMILIELEKLNVNNLIKEFNLELQFPKLLNVYSFDDIVVLEVTWIEGDSMILNEMNSQLILNRIIPALNKILDEIPVNGLYTFEDKFWPQLKNTDLIRNSSSFNSSIERKLSKIFSKVQVQHGDLHVGNIILINSGKFGIIDWEYASIAPNQYDIAYFMLFSGIVHTNISHGPVIVSSGTLFIVATVLIQWCVEKNEECDFLSKWLQIMEENKELLQESDI